MLSATWFAAVSYERHQQEGLQEAIVVTERAEAYGQFGAEVHMAAQALVAEIGGFPNEWDEVFDTFLGRVESDLFPNTLEAVLKQLGSNGHWQFVGMGDKTPDYMTTKQGLAAIAFAEKSLRAYYAGTYEYSVEGAHSFCVPSACKRASAYFGQFAKLAEHTGHHYYGGERLEKVEASFAPNKSPRPIVRPSHIEQSVAQSEQTDQLIDDVINEVLAQN